MEHQNRIWRGPARMQVHADDIIDGAE